ncbi:hypothetical protein H6F89_11330 [Cyanobacteria bacterium FACHB-63]|nr:hypothetical protein [Cyanobacteria bacterium FACHB-63]
MSQQDNFSGGFVLGAIVGGIVGGIIGSVVTAQRFAEETEDTQAKSELPKPKRRMRPSTEQNIELARRGLEDKIAQLNDAIDDVRQQLGNVNGRAIENDLPGAREIIREE